MLESVRLFGVALGLLAMTLLLVPLQLLALRFGWPLQRALPRLWHRGACVMTGVRVVVRGAPASGRPLLLTSNHQSWADMMALGSVVDCSFIAKSQVAGWPLFGWLARLQRTVFVERERRGHVGRQADTIGQRLRAGDAMVLFAEGTTSDGNRVLPFKTALFGAAQSALGDGRNGENQSGEVLVQPVAIAWVRLHGLPLGRAARPLVAWTGSLELKPHFLAFLRHGAFDVEVSFGEPLVFSSQSDRKAVAKQCRAQVSRLLQQALHPSPERFREAR